jgi:hypothetical protein
LLVALMSAAVLLAAAETPTPPAGADAPAAAAKPKNKDMELVCWQEKPTGSHFTKRVCTTRIERERMERQGQQAIGDHPRTGARQGGFGG